VLHVTPGWQFPEHHQKLSRSEASRHLFPVDDMLIARREGNSAMCC